MLFFTLPNDAVEKHEKADKANHKQDVKNIFDCGVHAVS
jgi:hypothetical protein